MINVDNKYLSYAEDVISGKVVSCELIKLACRRYLSWFKRDDIVFRADRCDRAVNFISKLKHFKGKDAGKNFILLPWQEWIVYSIFGWYWKDRPTKRVINKVYVEISRKCGKSTFAAAISLYTMIADGEAGAENIFVANNAKQAGICFDVSSKFCNGIDPSGKYFKRYRDKIKFDLTNSFIQVLSSDAGSADGWNPHCFVCDEVHEYPDSSLYDVLISGQGARENPLAFLITTAGFNKYGFCYNYRTSCEEVLRDLKKDDSLFSAIFTLDDDDDWRDENVWIKACPSLDATVTRDYLRGQVVAATNNSSLETSVRTKNFNVWVDSISVWIPDKDILSCSANVDLKTYEGMSCFVGIDLSSVSDLTAVSVMIPLQYEGKYVFKSWAFLPKAALSNNENSSMYLDWYRKGFLHITPGNCIDYDYILKTIKDINNGLSIYEVGYDQWNSTQFVINAQDEGINMTPISQSIGNFSKGTKELERIIRSGRAIIDNNPITRWCFSNVEIKEDWNSNQKPVKSTAMGKIDVVISSIMALQSYLQSPQYNNSVMIV